MRRWVTWLAPLVIFIILAMIFRDQLPFIGEGMRELAQVSPLALTPVFLFTGASLLSMALVMRELMAAGGVRVSVRETSAITVASNSWSTSLPGGPAFSAVFTYQVQRDWGASRLLCSWFFVLSGAVSTLWLVLIGMSGVLFLGTEVSLWSLLLSFGAMTGLSMALYWAANNSATLERWVRARMKAGSGVEKVVRSIRQLESVRLSPQRFASVTVFSGLNRGFDVLSLCASVWAVTGEFNGQLLMGVLLAYTTAKIAGSAQVTPGGLGTVEAGLIAALVAAGMTAVDATAVAVIYRLISFILVALIGWVVYFFHYARRGNGLRLKL